jgi:hypothetical protein
MGKAVSSVVGAAGTALGSVFGPVGGAIGGLAGTALGAGLSQQGQAAAPGLVRIGTGNSTFKRTGSNNNSLDITIDPSIREGQETFLSNVRGLRGNVDPAFDIAQSELGEIREEIGGLRSFFEGSGFTDAALNPVREGIDARKGELTRELGRTDVRGSFRDASLNKFGFESSRTLTDATASVEGQRIQNLSTLLGIDSTLIQQSLQNETGRTNLLLSLEESLRGVSTERFNQEMQLLSQGTGIQTTPFQQQSQANTEGIFAGAAVENLGTILEGFNTDTPSPSGPIFSGSPTGTDTAGTPF